jgi:hypothetical protein
VGLVSGEVGHDLCDRTILGIVKVERSSMRIRYVLLFLGWCMVAWVQAQSGELRFLVVDSADRAAISDVQVQWEPRGFAVTNKQGRASVPWNGSAPITVRFSLLGYDPLTRTITPDQHRPGDEVRIRLVSNTRSVPEVTVTRAKPEVIFQRTDVHAADLLINDEGLWVLAYKHPRLLREEGEAGQEILRDVRLVLLDTLFHEVTRCAVGEDVKALRRDPANAVIIEGASKAYGVGRTEENGLVLVPFGLEDLKQRILPWTDTITGYVLGNNADQVMPSFDHLAYDPRTDSARVVCTVVDTFMMELFRSEYRFLKGPEKVVALNLASELGVDKEVIAGYMSGFQHNIWYKPIYAPLFVAGDTLLVFDHAKARLRKFTRDLREVGYAALPYLDRDQGRDWSGKLLQDRATDRIYAVFERNGFYWLRPIDPVTGALGEKKRITYKYPERLQVHGGSVWYIYRPQESPQKRSIYRERM